MVRHKNPLRKLREPTNSRGSRRSCTPKWKAATGASTNRYVRPVSRLAAVREPSLDTASSFTPAPPLAALLLSHRPRRVVLAGACLATVVHCERGGATGKLTQRSRHVGGRLISFLHTPLRESEVLLVVLVAAEPTAAGSSGFATECLAIASRSRNCISSRRSSAFCRKLRKVASLSRREKGTYPAVTENYGLAWTATACCRHRSTHRDTCIDGRSHYQRPIAGHRSS
jgi:hypothetical protein